MVLDPSKIYYWRIDWDKGSVDDLTQRKLSREDRIDPQCPPTEYGQARRITLVPLDPSYPEIVMNIPEGAIPICHRHVTRDNLGSGSLRFLLYRIGYQVGNTRTMKAVDLFTRKIFAVEDSSKG
ncbi:hypothetical protein M0R72_07770 [Candidatus Pacearchaeota archaeon]|nr:hypothetical protein [Candidatus Pacearchaeota archaeon]